VAAGLALFSRIDAGGNYILKCCGLLIFAWTGHHGRTAHGHRDVVGTSRAKRTRLGGQQHRCSHREPARVALLPAVADHGDSYLHPPVFETGFQHAAFIASVICAAGGCWPPPPSATVSTQEASDDRRMHHSLRVDAPPLRTGQNARAD